MPTLRISDVQIYCSITSCYTKEILAEDPCWTGDTFFGLIFFFFFFFSAPLFSLNIPHPTHIQGLQTVPAEGVLAVLAHHLCAALVPLYVDFTFWTTFDWRVVFFILVKRARKKRELSFVDFIISSCVMSF